MADMQLDNQTPPAAPEAGKVIIFPHSSNKQVCSLDDTGKVLTLGGVFSTNIADVTANAADTILATLAIPSHKMQAQMLFHWGAWFSKTAAGIAAPTWNIRVGTLGTTGDTSRILFTGGVQTAVVDKGIVDIWAILRNIGAAGVLAGGFSLQHIAAGIAPAGPNVLQVTSAGFDTTVANLIVSLSINPGAAGVWAHQLVAAEMFGI